MAIELISKIKPKNNGTFALVDAHDVDVNGIRLDEIDFGDGNHHDCVKMIDDYLYIWDRENQDWVNTGIGTGNMGTPGRDGNGIRSVTFNDDYTLTLNFTDGTFYTTPSIRGIQGEKGDKGDRGIQGEQGVQGDKGEQGIQGIKGDTGETPVFEIGVVNSGNATERPEVWFTNSASQNSYVLNFKIPRGVDGDGGEIVGDLIDRLDDVEESVSNQQTIVDNVNDKITDVEYSLGELSNCLDDHESRITTLEAIDCEHCPHCYSKEEIDLKLQAIEDLIEQRYNELKEMIENSDPNPNKLIFLDKATLDNYRIG